ncbi:hypothetical protein AtEden1_Chr5g0091721 [Arabidopsis thaliana]
MSKEKSYVIALLLSLLLGLSSQVGVSEANYNAVTTRYSDSPRCANGSSASPPTRHCPRGRRPRLPQPRIAVHSNSTKGKGP